MQLRVETPPVSLGDACAAHEGRIHLRLQHKELQGDVKVPLFPVADNNVLLWTGVSP